MKKIITISLIAFTLLSVFSINVSADEIEYKVNLSYEVERNTGIGDEFEIVYYINDKEVEDGDILFLNKEDKIRISADVSEMDDYPDEGQASGSVYLNEDDSTTREVIYAELTEYMGRRNKDAEATVDVIFEFVPQIEKTTTVANATPQSQNRTPTTGEKILLNILLFTFGLYFIATFYFALLFFISMPLNNKYENEIKESIYKKSCIFTHIIPSGLFGLSVCILLVNDIPFDDTVLLIYFLILIINSVILYIYYLKKLKKELLIIRQKYAKYQNKSLTEIFNIMFKTNLDITFIEEYDTVIPQHKNNAKFGEYTVYISNHGSKIHYKENCCNANIPFFIYDKKISRFLPCLKCQNRKAELPITFEQYQRFSQVITEMKKYKIPISEIKF